MSRDVVRHVAFALAFVAMGLAGRTTIYHETDTSLIWPAAGVAVLWWLATRRAQRWWVLAAVAVLSVAINRSTGADTPLALVFGLTNTLQLWIVGALLTHPGRPWRPVVWRGPLDHTAQLIRIGAASVAGTLPSALIGVGALWLLREYATVASSLTWWGRNAVGCMLVVAVGVLGREAVLRASGQGWRTPLVPARIAEGALLVSATVALVAADLRHSYVPLSYFLPALTVWAGMRFTPVAAALHAVLAATATITLTLADQGPFSRVADDHLSILLSQLFVGITSLIALYIALARTENERLAEQLRAERESLAGYARTVAHDLLNPLTAIRGWIEIIGDAPPGNGPDRIAVQRVASAAARMQELVRDLLADAQSHDLALEREVVDMTEVAKVAAETYPQVEVEVEAIPAVLGDAGMLEQVVTNLVGNAVKYAVPGCDPEVVVRGFHRSEETVVLQVLDRGIGIPPHELHRVFESFHRVPGNDRDGTGLGLAICRRIVDRHGGTIVARNRNDGPGTLIEVTLPAAAG